MRNLKYLIVLLTVAALAGCGGMGFNTAPGGTAVKSRKPSAALEVPPDLVSTTSDAITSARAEQEALDKRQVLPESYLTELVQDGDKQWLEIDASPQNVWHRMVGYWDSLGVGLVVSQPQTGTMETSWMAPERRPGVLASVFAGLNDAGYDKYRVRLERAGENRTRLYVEHTWSQKILVTYPLKDPESTWVESEDPEKELELLKAVAFEMDPTNILGG
jgi:outer membrane protein assembly factor BamC